MVCRACSESTLTPLWQDHEGCQWYRCLFCGSDTAARNYSDIKHRYNGEYLKKHHNCEDSEELDRLIRPNLDWFVDWKVKDDVGKDFLDVGCCEGSGLKGMAERGFSVHGFDVIPEAHREGCTTIAPVFMASLFKQKFHAVLCREVIEHVETPMQFITELYHVTAKGGFLQIQTPRPDPGNNQHAYQWAHLVILSPFWIRYWVEKLGFEIKDYRIYGDIEGGQMWLCKKL